VAEGQPLKPIRQSAAELSVVEAAGVWHRAISREVSEKSIAAFPETFQVPAHPHPLTPSLLSSVPTPSRSYWRSTIRLILILLGVWALVSIGAGILFVRPLNHLSVGRLPAGFWMAQQGSILVFVALIYIFARRMDVLDHRYGKDVEDDRQ
jgi:putative solute:sodium symporter small subunit